MIWIWIILSQEFLRQPYFANNTCIQNTSVSNDNVSNIMSQFDFWFFGYSRHFHFRKLDWYSNPNINPTSPNLGPPNLNLEPVRPNLGPNISSNMHWQIDLRWLYFIKIELSQCLWSWNDLQFNQNYAWIFFKYLALRLDENWRSFHDHKYWANFILIKYNHLKSICQYILQFIFKARLEGQG